MTLNYKLILKQYGLTNDEYKQLYNSLVKDSLVKIPFNLVSMNYIINRLKYLSKSTKKNFKNCPRKFQFSRILRPKIESNELTYFDVYGGNLHLGCNKVWNVVKKNINKIINYNNENKIRDYFYSKCMEFVPEHEKTLDIYINLFWKYSEYEAYRITEIVDEVGKEKCKKYIIPAYREVEIENHEVYEGGKLDVVYLLTDDTHAIVDYKFGKAKYYDPMWNTNVDPELIDTSKFNYDKSEIDFELGSYFNLISDIKNVYKMKDVGNGRKELEELEYINFAKGLILYLRDWKNTFHYIPLNDSMIANVNRIKSDIIQTINRGSFPLRMSSNCFEYCNFIDICVKDKIWINKLNIDPNVKNKLNYIFFED
ncbi:hypothetical protein LCGC14_0546610 [marine sediment metagenome]|uniref:PD-(D/E)XK endonuclease-like domain-containing protein n=1 Tax=marine sediment metagenome TaxID=412755 RepID=A0A0F9UCK5_9ZZZZ